MAARTAVKEEEKSVTEEAIANTEVKRNVGPDYQMVDIELARPFSPDVTKRLSKGGQSFDYIPISEVIARLNFVLGTDGWQELEATTQRDSIDTDWVISHVVLAKRTPFGDWVMKHGYGGSAVKYKKDGGVLDLGDDFKGAHSDAFKKAATQLGVALDIARTEEAIEAEHADRQRVADDAHPLASEEDLQFITDAIGTMDDEHKMAFKKFWTANIPYSLTSGKLTTAHTARIREHFDA